MKKMLLVGLLAALVLVSGCMKIIFRENVGADGVSSFVMTLEAVNKTASEDDATADPCKDLKQDSPRFTDVKCSYDRVNKIITLSGKLDRKGTPGLTMMGGRYRLDVQKALDDMDDDGGEQTATKTTLPKAEQKKQMEELRKTGFVYDYYVKMPGRVISQKGGTQQLDGSVKFDLIDMPEGAYVESEAGALDAVGSIVGNQVAEQLPAGTSSNPIDAVSGNCCCMPFLSVLIAGLGALAAKMMA